uniref:phosphorylase kinase n=1 Tax=Cacopsylla melanoneura TaxID=428564 RepID=A0A8D8QHQ0_9HEMI
MTGSSMALDDTLDTNKDDDILPDRDVAKEFYAKYEPKEILGRGISSTVRRCIEKETGVEYAAKIIDLSADPENKNSTLEEVRILRLVAGHPFIIHLHDVFESETFIFLVFELCKNGELFDHLTSVVALSEKKTRYIMRQLFEALDHVHSHNVVHRDLKPENILLDDLMNVKLTDFGFAHVLKKGEKLMELCGTPGYLAPEVLKANMFEDATGYGQPVDLWACGVIMFTLLVGCPPFWHRKQMVMLRSIMEGKYCFSSPEWNDVSEDSKNLIRQLLVVNPDDRCSVKDALNHAFFHPKLFDQDIEPIKKDYKMASRKLSKIIQMTEVRTCQLLKPVMYDDKNSALLSLYAVLKKKKKSCEGNFFLDKTPKGGFSLNFFFFKPPPGGGGIHPSRFKVYLEYLNAYNELTLPN